MSVEALGIPPAIPNSNLTTPVSLPILPVRLPQVELPGDGRSISAFISELAQHLGNGPIFYSGDAVSVLKAGKNKLEPMENAAALPSFIEDYVETGSTTVAGADRRWKIKSLTESNARMVLESDRFKDSIRPLHRLCDVRLPIRRGNGVIELVGKGYDEPSGIYTLDTIPFDLSMDIRRARRILETLFNEFPFASASVGSFKSAALAMILAPFCDFLVSSTAPRPGFLINANKVNLGKTTLGKLGLLPVFGSADVRKPFSLGDDPDLKKILTAVIRDGIPYLFFDNCAGRIENRTLEGFMTSNTYTCSVLWKDTQFRGEKRCVVVIVAQPGARLNEDLKRRFVTIELFAEQTPDFVRPLDTEDILIARPAILGACWSYVRHWQSKKCKPSSVTFPGFAKWSEVIGGIIETAGHASPFATRSRQSDLDQSLPL